MAEEILNCLVTTAVEATLPAALHRCLGWSDDKVHVHGVNITHVGVVQYASYFFASETVKAKTVNDKMRNRMTFFSFRANVVVEPGVNNADFLAGESAGILVAFSQRFVVEQQAPPDVGTDRAIAMFLNA